MSVDLMIFVATAGISYLFGSLSSAILVCKFMRLPDPRTQGSKNPGATNVLRIGGKKAAIYTLGGDLLKAFIPVMLVHITLQQPVLTMAALLGAFLGHLYPLFFGFRGGKGVATGIGGILGFAPLLACSLIAVWLLIIYITRYSSLAAIIAAIIAPVLTWFIYPENNIYLYAISAMCLLLLWRHRTNIINLWQHKESKIA